MAILGHYPGGTVDFGGATSSDGWAYFREATFSGGTVYFNGTFGLVHPPKLDWHGTPPGVLRPAQSGGSPVLTPQVSPFGH